MLVSGWRRRLKFVNAAGICCKVKVKNEKKGISLSGYTLIPRCRLSTETELLYDSPVSLDVDFLKIVKYTTSFTYELQKRATG